MRYQQTYIIRGRVIGFSLRKAIHVHEDVRAPIAYAFFCPACGDVWARCPVIDTFGGAQELFHVLQAPCEKHPLWHMAIPGSIYLGWDLEFSEAFPDEMVKYEFAQALKLYPES